MTVAEIMTTEVITAGMDDTLGGIRKVFQLNNCHHMPIIEDNRLVGIVSDRDVLKGLSPTADLVIADNRALKTLKKKAHQVMTRNVTTISPEDTVEEAAAVFLEMKFSCLPVLEKSGKLVGIITKTDLLESMLARTLAASI
jgi:acetoin utilization protein AcuB